MTKLTPVFVSAGATRPLAVAVEEELQHRQEPLQVGLLVDREVEVAVGDRLERLREEVVPAGPDAAGMEPVLPHDRGNPGGRAGVDGEESTQVGIRRDRSASIFVCSPATSTPLATTWALIVLPESRIASSAPSIRGWMFCLTRRGDEQEDVAVGDEADDAGAELEAGLVVVLADIGEPGVRLPAVGVVGDDRDPALEGERRRPVEGLRIDERDRDPGNTRRRSPAPSP